MWNRAYTVYKRTQVSVPSHIHILGRAGLVRNVEAVTTTLAYTGREGEPLPNPEETEYREIVLQTAPSYLEGIATLTWRFADARWDSLWVYVPFARRVRQANSANRSDALAGSDVTLDDALVWAGKNQSFTWKLVGQAEILVPAMSLDPQPLHPGATWQNGQEWKTADDYVGVRWGYEQPGWAGAPWAPTNAYWVKRPVWIVEGHPLDRYYSYWPPALLRRSRHVSSLRQGHRHARRRVLEDRAGRPRYVVRAEARALLPGGGDEPLRRRQERPRDGHHRRRTREPRVRQHPEATARVVHAARPTESGQMRVSGRS